MTNELEQTDITVQAMEDGTIHLVITSDCTIVMPIPTAREMAQAILEACQAVEDESLSTATLDQL